jgi:xanthosine utilization system XapX-like protein
MTSELRRMRRLRLVVGIVAGIVVGTVHALVSHVTSRGEPAVTVVEQVGWFATDTDVAAR